MILVSLTNDTKDTPSINSNWEIFKTVPIESSRWGHYEHSLYNNFKAHWINGVNMYDKYGQHELANNWSTVCVSNGDYDFSELLNKFNRLPKNTIIFDEMKRAEFVIGLGHTPEPYPTPTTFVASYSCFMKLVNIWKWIDSYTNEPFILERDSTREILIRTMWQRNMQWTSLEEPDEQL